MKLQVAELTFLGICLEGFLFGLYSGIFSIYLLLYRARNRGTDNTKQNLTFYALCVLYALTTAVVSLDIALVVVLESITGHSVSLYLDDCQTVVFGCCDFIAQIILIYRCWIVWDHNIRVVIVPLIIASAYLVMWIATTGSLFIPQSGITHETVWGNDLVLTALTASMTVNALVTGLIVFKIFKVFHEVKRHTTSDEKSSGIVRGSKFRSVIFIIFESALALSAIQLTRLIFAILAVCLPAHLEALAGGYNVIICIHEMLNGITPTIILVRVAMGFSFHDELSLEASIDSLRFAADNRDSTPEISIQGDDSLDDGYGSLHIGHDGPGDVTEERDGREIDEIQMVG